MRKAQAEVLPWKGPGPFLQDMSLQELWLASAPLGWLGGEHRGQESWARRPCKGQERMLWAVGGRAQQCSEDRGLTQGLATTPRAAWPAWPVRPTSHGRSCPVHRLFLSPGEHSVSFACDSAAPCPALPVFTGAVGVGEQPL